MSAPERKKRALPIPLDEIPTGRSGIVISMEFPGDFSWKFMEMGFGVGRQVRVVRRAPLGDPIEVELIGYRLAVRAQDVRGILLRLLPCKDTP